MCQLPKRSRQSAPFATVLRHVENGIERLQVGDADVAPLYREVGGDAFVLFLRHFESADCPHTSLAHIIRAHTRL